MQYSFKKIIAITKYIVKISNLHSHNHIAPQSHNSTTIQAMQFLIIMVQLRLQMQFLAVGMLYQSILAH